ncbi:unnamed protein product [Moneuplotes crassus]|uniref:EF-hand domain-containing protein n=1 Tax=Euplotes crassus TaxID=5936 RepID=A0AAD1XK16_EUPCR|nr:unnamed protein product [Moneuplotes crassus]|eukprot:CAMPEP_0197015514 /NCGR_PEP_ID=MMETSP1380-20130617/74506_1 /TAXON_ID=5936 /ORGANISM="Euplotes crassus, Strain CT5" /LENGTH=75 /DNA_ID=CAMNT_0042441485 /DNA_START=11 /DNA_END=238 /DNA_ORIENTATION=+
MDPDQPTEDQLREVFNTFDRDGNGSIDAEEIQKVIQELGLDAKSSEIENLISEADKDGNGKIEFDEFKKAVLGED